MAKIEQHVEFLMKKDSRCINSIPLYRIGINTGNKKRGIQIDASRLRQAITEFTKKKGKEDLINNLNNILSNIGDYDGWGATTPTISVEEDSNEPLEWNDETKGKFRALLEKLQKLWENPNPKETNRPKTEIYMAWKKMEARLGRQVPKKMEELQ